MDKIDELLTRGVDAIYPTKEALEKVLRSGRKLRIYQGFDPTGIELHVGHMIGLRKLRQWQDLGHEVIFLIGDGTGQAGDPSGKTRTREKFLTNEELRKNAKDYVLQAKKVARFEGKNPVKILYNGDWLNKLKLADLLEIARHFSWQQLAERDLYQERIKKGETLNFREALYPLLQAYDSVAMDVDVELGGSDQLFNMLAGRTLLRAMKNKDKFVMTTPLLTDSEGRKIGKTEGNVIALDDQPEDLFGKIMALPDEVIVKGLEYLTDIPMEEVRSTQQKLMQGENPVTFKKRLAYEIVKQLNNQEAAREAQEEFEKTVQKKELPEDIPTLLISKKQYEGVSLADALIQLELADSKSDAKRLIEQGGVSVDNEVVTDSSSGFIPEQGCVIRVGKRKFVRIEIVE